MERIPAKTELGKRGALVADVNCSRCGLEPESTNHILSSCIWARAIWWQIRVWLKLPNPDQTDAPAQILKWIDTLAGLKDWKNVVIAIAFTTLWQIWKARNDMEFEQKSISIHKTVEDIKMYSYGLKTRDRWCD
ncbi:putative reverse transcriptase zinc-binding domain-containing protein [Helianthus anomalus]